MPKKKSKSVEVAEKIEEADKTKELTPEYYDIDDLSIDATLHRYVKHSMRYQFFEDAK